MLSAVSPRSVDAHPITREWMGLAARKHRRELHVELRGESRQSAWIRHGTEDVRSITGMDDGWNGTVILEPLVGSIVSPAVSAVGLANAPAFFLPRDRRVKLFEAF